MSGFQVERRDYTSIAVLMSAVVVDMLAAGFTQIVPSSPFVPGTDKMVLLQAGPTVDPLSTTKPWQIKLDWSKDPNGTAISETANGGACEAYVGTPLQFNQTTGAHTMYLIDPSITTVSDAIGIIGGYAARATTGNAGNSDRRFMDRTRLLKTAGNDSTLAYPMSYQLSITPRGFALFVWEQASDASGNKFSWICVQRPVDKTTGSAIITGKTPVHCVYGLMDSSAVNQTNTDTDSSIVRRFIVREDDVVVPYPAIVLAGKNFGVDATQHSVDYAAIMNAKQQSAISENNKYTVTFPSGLNTARYAYTYELDMIAYTSADVVSQGTDVPITVYGEASARSYRAMSANGPNNTGMRVLMLTAGGGIS